MSFQNILENSAERPSVPGNLLDSICSTASKTFSVRSPSHFGLLSSFMSNILSGASTATHLLIKIDRRIILVAGLVTPFLSVKRNALGTLKIQRRDGSESVA